MWEETNLEKIIIFTFFWQSSEIVWEVIVASVVRCLLFMLSIYL